jgi:hypothetical protein
MAEPTRLVMKIQITKRHQLLQTSTGSGKVGMIEYDRHDSDLQAINISTGMSFEK